MKYLLTASAFCLLYASFAFGQPNEINIVPRPSQVRTSAGYFELKRDTKILATNAASIRIANILNDMLWVKYGFRLKVVSKEQKRNLISIERFGSAPGITPNSERYMLGVLPERIRLLGEENGLFYGIGSLIQLISADPNGPLRVPSLEIVDEPRFLYRGMHLDVSRHFFPVEFVKKYIDLMSQYKFNKFHWHLTDDQGWRIEITKYPKLTEIGSKRPETVKGRVLQPYVGDGVPVEGFYTQEQIKDVIAYAKARYITVIPEIELPGHASAALAAYPQLGCKVDYTYKVQTTWGIFKEVFCPTDVTFKFLEDVLDETIALFPDSPYIHIGGDEVLKDHWKESPFVQDLMKRENLKDEHEVQSYFIRRIEKFINSKGKKIIGWDEILEGGLAPNATVMSWRGMKGGIEAAKAKHDVIMTPTDYAYLDYGQGDPATEPINIGGYLPLEKVYSFDPVPNDLTADEAKYIIGGQGNIWTEYLKKGENVEYMAFPRMLAIAESVWSTRENKNYGDFRQRLNAQLARLDAQNVNYRIPESPGLMNRVLADGEAAILDLSTPIPGARVFYTIDGSTPDEKSTLFIKPLQIDVPKDGRVDVKAVVVIRSGRKSSVYTATILRGPWQEPEPELKEKRPGANFGMAFPIANDRLGSVFGGEARSLNFRQIARGNDLKLPFGVSFSGFINVPADGIYEFQAESTWETAITVGEKCGLRTAGTPETSIRSFVCPLKAGLQKIGISYSHRGGEPFWRLRWAIKGQNWRNLNGGELVH